MNQKIILFGGCKMFNTYLTTVMAVISLLALAARFWVKDYALKSRFTLAALPILSILAIVQAIIAKIPRVSVAWWLLLAIFIVLLVNTSISYSAWKKEHESDEEAEPEKPVEEKTEEVTEEGKPQPEAKE